MCQNEGNRIIDKNGVTEVIGWNKASDNGAFHRKEMHHLKAKHQNGARLSLFQLIELLIQLGDVMNSWTSFFQGFMQKGICQQINQAIDRGIAIKSRNAIKRGAEMPAG